MTMENIVENIDQNCIRNSDNFNKLKKKFLENYHEYHYLFEISKCCGYSELVSCTKEDTLAKLYNHVSFIFRKKIKLFILIGVQKVWIPSCDLLVKDYLREMTDFLKPEYPLPHDIVYKIYIDDGHCQIDHNIPSSFICVSCDFHGKKSK
jgi:hypothetical protein